VSTNYCCEAVGVWGFRGVEKVATSRSGFSWYRMSKLEHQFVNLRHIQHHAAQLADRLRSAAGVGIKWVASCPRS
jgi:hypothetical protein